MIKLGVVGFIPFAQLRRSAKTAENLSIGGKAADFGVIHISVALLTPIRSVFRT